MKIKDSQFLDSKKNLRNMKYSYLIFAFLLVLLIIPLGSAEIKTFKSGEEFPLRHTITADGKVSEIISANITVLNPDSIVLVASQPMTFDSSSQQWNYTLNSTQTKELGIYQYTICAVSGIGDKCETFTIKSTPSGAEEVNSGQGMIIIFIMLIIFSIFVLLFISGFIAKGLAFKSILFSGSGVALFTLILYSLVVVNEIIPRYTKTIGGFETFYYVIGSILMAGVMGLAIMVIFILYLMFKKKRGLID